MIPAGGAYPQGATVVLEAVPSEYYQFAGWSGAVVSNNNPLSVVMDGDRSLTATFAEQLTDNTQTPLLWLVGFDITNDFEAAALQTGANGLSLWQSYVAGLNPADPYDTLELGVELGGAGRVITLERRQRPRLHGAPQRQPHRRLSRSPAGASCPGPSTPSPTPCTPPNRKGFTSWKWTFLERRRPPHPLRLHRWFRHRFARPRRQSALRRSLSRAATRGH